MTTADRHHAKEADTRQGPSLRMWLGMVVSAIVLACLMLFIFQNTQDLRVHFMNWHFSMPVGVCLLLSAVAGGLVTALLGGLRTLLRRH